MKRPKPFTGILVLLATTTVSASDALGLRAIQHTNRVEVLVAGKPFTEYRFDSTDKFPLFHPVNGPRSGQSVTTRNTEPYPHHSSIWFGCDRVNGGNYWQEGLERGRIVSRSVKLARAEGPEIVIEQDCDWERPGAPSPFQDRRRIVLRAPSTDRREVDFDITLTAKIKVRIEKTNHSLFAARMAPELAKTAGGALQNAAGDRGEKGTFGKPSPWADYRGTRDGVTEGVAILAHPANRWHPSPWFTRDYGFFSPTPMNWLEAGFVEFAEGETLRLRYRVIVHADAPSNAALEAASQRFSDE